MALQQLLSLVQQGRASVAFFAPEPSGNPLRQPVFEDVTVFQYWPSQLQDSHPPNYASKQIPGGSHPLKQWIGGDDRTISFEAVFTRELKDDTLARAAGAPSARYTVDLAAARSRIERFKQPHYRRGAQTGIIEAPERLVLYLPRMQLGGNVDQILCYMTGADFTYEKCYSDGTPRIMAVSFTFTESVQFSRGSGIASQGSAIRFHGRERWESNAPLYKYVDGDSAYLGGAGGI